MTELLPGTEVIARNMRWEVVSTQQLGPQTLFRLRGLEGAFHGTEFDLLHPFEPIEPVIHEFQPDRAVPLPYWRVYHQGFLLEQMLGHDAFLVTQPGRLRVEPYQLVPVLRAIRMSRARILLADGVGLGKTIQAGLVLTELMARRLAHRVLVVSPAGPLLEQWKTEMRERFGLRLTVIDRAALDEIRKSTELGANPFDHIALGLASIDFLKQERILDQLERATYDAVVIDEAHHCMDLGGAGEREDSQRRRLAEVLARRCDCLILATATPHDGSDRSFASLCELLDYSLVDGRGSLRGVRYRDFVVRRLKDHIKDPITGEPKFKQRIVIPVPVGSRGEAYAPFRDLQKSLVEMIGPELKKAFRNKRYNDVLSFIALLKRSVSSVAACASTLRVVSSRFSQLILEREESQESRKQRLTTLRDYNRRLERFGALGAAEEHERETLEAEDLAHSLAGLQRELRAGGRRLKWATDLHEGLLRLLSLAERASSRDPKLDQVLAEIRAIRAEAPDANVLVYTEYVTTQTVLVANLREAGIGDVLPLSGEDDDADRSTKTQRFRDGTKLVMVSTDAAAEGLNLHQRCHHLIHVELPFNPNRLEQRNGRIDRYGQTEPPIVRYLYLSPSFEERILLRLIAKYERQRSRLTCVPNTLGHLTSSDAMSSKLLQGLAEEEGWLLREESAPYFTIEEAAENDGADPATLELLEEIDRSLAGFEKLAKDSAWLGEAGLNAEQGMMTKADQAMAQGRRESMVDLAQFLVDAVRQDGGEVEGLPSESFFGIALPMSWSHSLEDLPGYDTTTRRVYLTTDINVTSTSHGRPVAFLGRAHPLLRRALDRVRQISYGGEASRGLDMRVSAVTAPVESPTLLLTFLGRVTSDAGREFERVVAVLAEGPGRHRFMSRVGDWVSLIERDKAISTREVWKRHFSNGWAGTVDQARSFAEAHFAPLAEAFAASRRTSLGQERAELDVWLAQRTLEIAGEQPIRAVQQELFSRGGSTGDIPSWQLAVKPLDRLAGFASDGSQPHFRRSEAEGVIRLYRVRWDDLHARFALHPPEVVRLGMLMVIPEGAVKGGA